MPKNMKLFEDEAEEKSVMEKSNDEYLEILIEEGVATELTEEEKYKAACMMLNDYVKKDETWILVPVKNESGATDYFSRKIEEATPEEFQSWLFHVYPAMKTHGDKIKDYTKKADRMYLFESAAAWQLSLRKAFIGSGPNRV